MEGAVMKGAVEGTVAGAVITAPSIYLLNRRWPYFRTLPPSLKALGTAIVVFPLMIIQAEHRMLEYERLHWVDTEKYAVQRREHEERLRWASLGAKDKLAEWTARHQLSVIVGSWALAMTTAGTIIMRDPHLPVRHKVVQARVWAQGLTLGVLIATGALTHSQRTKAAYTREHGDDHSWMDVLEDQRRAKERVQREVEI